MCYGFLNTYPVFNFFAREWAELKSAMALKHRTVNSVYVWACLVAVILVVSVVEAGMAFGYYPNLSAGYALSFVGIAALLGLYRVMKNQKDGIVWLLISFICANLIAFTTSCIYYDRDVSNTIGFLLRKWFNSTSDDDYIVMPLFSYLFIKMANQHGLYCRSEQRV